MDPVLSGEPFGAEGDSIGKTRHKAATGAEEDSIVILHPPS